jgi:hypothetical protein
MSKQTSLVTFTGKMGGISFFQRRNGEYAARKSGGPKKERILTDPAFERTRENMSEFGGLAMAVGSLSRVFSPVKNLRDTGLRGRASKLFRTMMRFDVDHVRGKRPILVSQYGNELLDLEINEKSAFKSSFGAKYVTTNAADRKLVTTNIALLKVRSMVSAPKDATHFQLVQLAGVLADTVYNADVNRYECADPVLDTVSNVTFSEYIPLGNDDQQSVTLETPIPIEGALNGQVTVVQALGILFFTQDGTAYYPLNQGKGMRIVAAY